MGAFWWALAWWQWPAAPEASHVKVYWLLLVPALITPTLLAIQFIVQWHVNRHDSAPRASALEYGGAWLAEAVAAVHVFHWWQPFRHHAQPDVLQPDSRRGVVLVHGFFCNRAFWTHWLRRFSSEGRVCLAVDLEPAYGSIEDYVTVIDNAVARVAQLTGQPPLIVAHSMGGLAVRAWLQARAGLERVHKVVTLGTPHQGTWIARFSHGRNGAQMRQNGNWLKTLQDAENPQTTSKFVCYYSNCDNIVFPVSTATLAGADNRHEPARGHVELAFSDRIVRETWQLLG